MVNQGIECFLKDRQTGVASINKILTKLLKDCEYETPMYSSERCTAISILLKKTCGMANRFCPELRVFVLINYLSIKFAQKKNDSDFFDRDAFSVNS